MDALKKREKQSGKVFLCNDIAKIIFEIYSILGR